MTMPSGPSERAVEFRRVLTYLHSRGVTLTKHYPDGDEDCVHPGGTTERLLADGYAQRGNE